MERQEENKVTKMSARVNCSLQDVLQRMASLCLTEDVGLVQPIGTVYLD